MRDLVPVRPNEDIRIRRAVTPILLRTPTEGRQAEIGTGVFVMIGGVYFIFTAGHAVKAIKQNNNTFAVALEGDTNPLWFTSGALFHFVKDGVDYGIIGLHNQIYQTLINKNNINWVTIDELFVVNEKLDKELRFNAMGYPGAGAFWDSTKSNHLGVTMTKMSGPLGPANMKIFPRGKYSFTNPDIAGIETLELTVPKKQILVALNDSEYSNDPDKLKGMSGGGFWLTPREEDNPSEVKLFSILSSHFDNGTLPKQNGEECIHIRVVKISSHLHLVYKQYPFLQKTILYKFPMLPKIWEEHIANETPDYTRQAMSSYRLNDWIIAMDFDASLQEKLITSLDYEIIQRFSPGLLAYTI
jgi:hypothetical protein